MSCFRERGEKMGLFSKLFQNIKIKSADYYGYTSVSAPFSKDLYEQETVRAIIDCIATHAAKGNAQHVIVDSDGRIKEIKYNSIYAKLINHAPNTLMSGFDFKYKLITQLQCRNTAMAYIKWNINNKLPEYILPVDYSNFRIYRISGGNGYAVQFTDNLGEVFTLNADDVIFLRKFYNRYDVSGDGNSCIYNSLNMVKASDEGFIDSLAVANKVRGIHKHKKAMLDPNDIAESQRKFAERFEKAAKEGGIVSIDSQEEYIPLNISSYSANAAQMQTVRNNLFTYWRTPECIVRSDYTEQQGMAWYESVIDPIWIMMSQCFTNACFTGREKDVGNRIIFGGAFLTGTSYETRIKMLDAVREKGILTDNEERALIGYPPVEGGDVRHISLNYVEADKLSEYQELSGGDNNNE